jgi:hypothetical protein
LEHSIAGVRYSLYGSPELALGLGYNQPSQGNMLMPNGVPIIMEEENEPIDQRQLVNAAQRPSQSNEVEASQAIPRRALVSLSLTPGDSANELSQEEVQSMNEQIEHDLDPDSQVSAQELWEDIRSVSRKVLRLASEVLRSAHEENPSSPPAATSSVSRASNSAASQRRSKPKDEQLKNYLVLEDPTGAKWQIPLAAITSRVGPQKIWPWRASRVLTLIGY